MVEEIERGAFDIKPFDTAVNSAGDLPNPEHITEPEVRAIRRGNLAPDVVVPADWTGEGYERWISLVDGQELVTIPDSVVENFNLEDDEIQPGIYAESEDISDYYDDLGTDAFDEWEITDDGLIGDRALNRTDDGRNIHMVSRPGDGLNRYPDEGETVRFFLNDDDQQQPQVWLMVDDGDSPSGYGFGIDASNNSMGIIKESDISSGGTASVGDSTTNQSFSKGEWYVGEAELPTYEDDEIVFTMFEEEDGERGGELDSVSLNDDDFVGQRGIGFGHPTGSDTGVAFDGIEVIE